MESGVFEKMKILTEKGFKSFEGFINQGEVESLLRFSFENNEPIDCTEDHQFLCSDSIYRKASELKVGDFLYPDKLINSIERIDGKIEVYDALNVQDTHSYVTNSVVSHNCLYLDEFAFVPNADVFYTSTYPVISSGDSTKIIITSTPNGIGNLFHRIWERAVEGTNEFNPIRIHWWDVPGRDEKWKNETIANTSELQFRQEFGTEFLGTENNLISYEALMKLKAKDPISYFENGSVRIYKEPIDGHNYIMTVDVSSGVGKDYSTFTIFDITQKPFEQVLVFRNNRVPSILLSTFLYKYATSYNKAIVIIESNDEGKSVCNSLYYEFEYENTYMESSKSLGIRMTRSVKRIGCATIKELIEAGKIDISDENTIYEMTCFENDGFSYQASRGNNDDLMMNLVLFAYYTTTNSFSEISQSDIKTILYEDQINKIFDDILPFGYIEDGLNRGIQKNPWTLVDDF